MSSSGKRPAVTYQRAVKKNFDGFAASNGLDSRDLMLQHKIDDLMVSLTRSNHDENSKARNLLDEEEFDSAYLDSGSNAKKVHDLVQVGETRRFIDEIEYLMDGLEYIDSSKTTLMTTIAHSKLSVIRANLSELLERCFDDENGSGVGSVSFGLKLKSHGALCTIFEKLCQHESLIADQETRFKLILLISGLLHDVRRLDFFFTPKVALELARTSFAGCLNAMDFKDLKWLKKSLLFANLKTAEWKSQDFTEYFGIWLLSKFCFASVTRSRRSALYAPQSQFMPLLVADEELMGKLHQRLMGATERCQFRNKVAALMDCLLNNEHSVIDALPNGIVPNLIDLSLADCSAPVLKLLVSITGSSLGRHYLTSSPKAEAFASLDKLIRSALNESFSKEIQILSLSCVINLLDRYEITACEGDLLDELRFKNSKEDGEHSLLQVLVKNFESCPATATTTDDELPSLLCSLKALTLALICRQNHSNLAIVLGAASDAQNLKLQIHEKVFAFHQQQTRNHPKDLTEDDALILRHLEAALLAFKK